MYVPPLSDQTAAANHFGQNYDRNSQTYGRSCQDQQQGYKGFELSEVGATIGYLFQEPERQLFAPTVWEEVSFVMEIKGVPKETIDIEVGRILKQFHLSELGEASPFLLSRGEKQRLALAAIMVNNPSFFILDEPTTGLDMERKDVLSGILNSLLERGTGMIIISHDHKFVAKHADRVIEISGGEVVYDGHYLPGSQD